MTKSFYSRVVPVFHAGRQEEMLSESVSPFLGQCGRTLESFCGVKGNLSRVGHKNRKRASFLGCC